MAEDIERTLGKLESGFESVEKATETILSNMRDINREVIETGVKVNSAHKRIDETEKKILAIQPKLDEHAALHNQARGAAKVIGVKYGVAGGGFIFTLITILKAIFT